MADGTTFISVTRSGSAPEDYLVSGASSIDLLAARADFDGSGAGSDFLPALQIVDEAGQVVATTFGSTVAAGGSASVTFAPFLRGATATGGAGIDFNKTNDLDASGEFAVYLLTETIAGDGTTPNSSVLTAAAYSFVNTGGAGGQELVNDGDDAQALVQNGDGTKVDAITGQTKGQVLLNNGDGETLIATTGAGYLFLHDSGNSGVYVKSDGADVIVEVSNIGHLELRGLPVVNPGGSDRVWNNGGVLNIT